GAAQHYTDRAKRPGSPDPQLRRAGHVAYIGLATQYQDVDVVGFHLCQRPLPTAEPKVPAVGRNLSAHWRHSSASLRSASSSARAIGRIGVVGNRDTAVFGDHHDLL